MGSCTVSACNEVSIQVKPRVQTSKQVSSSMARTSELFYINPADSLGSSEFELYGNLSSNTEKPFDEKPITLKGAAQALISSSRLAVSSHKGSKHQPNQDNFFIQSYSSKLIAAVFDGHGLNGHLVSSLASKSLLRLSKSPSSDFKDLFSKTEKIILEKSNEKKIDISASGTTCTLLCVSGSVLKVSHIGDSKAAILRRKSGRLVASFLTPEHKPSNKAEFKRIEESGGRVMKRNKTDRVYTPESSQGLAVSRSFGDLDFKNFGVSAEPSTSEVKLTHQDEFLVAATDGMWDVIELPEIAEAVEGRSSVEACKELSKRAWNRWMSISRSSDDITLIIIPLK